MKRYNDNASGRRRACRYDADADEGSAKARPRQLRQSNAADLVRFLGWFSVALGVAEFAAPSRMAKLTGFRAQNVFGLLGIREFITGVGLLRGATAAPWMSARLVGDAIDLALLTSSLRAPGAPRNRMTTIAMVAAVTAIDAYTRSQLAAGEQGATWTPMSGVEVKKTVTINRSPETLYTFWRDFENLPRFMTHLQSVEETGERRSHWVAKAPAGMSVEWDAEITEDQPNTLIAWRSLPTNSDIDNFGSVHFERAPGGRGTIVRVELTYRPPGGTAGSLIAKLFGEEPTQQIDTDLRRFKQHMETGEISTTDGQPSARAA